MIAFARIAAIARVTHDIGIAEALTRRNRDAIAALAGDSAPAGYHQLHGVGGAEAREEIQRANAMTQNPREQELPTE
jgi:hypothetical protein